MPKQIVFGIVRSLHDIFSALWIGGMLTTTLSFMPVFKNFRQKRKELIDLLVGYQKRLAAVALISILGLWITGLLLSKQSPAYSGFLNFSSTTNTLLSIKHILILVMIIIALYRRFILGRGLRNFNKNQQKTYGMLLVVNTLLGVIVLFLSGIGASLSQAALMAIR